MSKLKKVLMISGFCLLSSCSMMAVDNNVASHTLDSWPRHLKPAKALNGNCLVKTPESDILFATTLMAYTKTPHKMDYFSNNRWAAEPALMLEPLLIKTLRRLNRFKTVLTPPTVARYDYVLKIKILDFEQDYVSHPAFFVFSFTADLTRMSDKKVIMSVAQTIKEPMKPLGLTGGVLAANRAMSRGLALIAAHIKKIG